MSIMTCVGRSTRVGRVFGETQPDLHILGTTLRVVNLAGLVALTSAASIVYGGCSIAQRLEPDGAIRPGLVWGGTAALFALVIVVAALARSSALGGVLLGGLVGLSFVVRSRRLPRDDR